MIQDCLSNGNQIYSVLKWKTEDSSYWINTLFKPGKQNKYHQNFEIETAFISTKCQQKIKKLYKTLSEIENRLGVDFAKKYLEGFLEEKDICFNELPYYLN